MSKFFEIIFELVGWIRIVLSPLTIGLIIGAMIYYPNQNTFSLIIGLFIAFIGLIIGIIWATREWKKDGTMNFLSRTGATPDIDEWLKKEKEKGK